MAEWPEIFLVYLESPSMKPESELLRAKSAEGKRVTAEDVNRASGQYYDDKLQELNKETTDEERGVIENEIDKIRIFCFEKAEANCILVNKESKGTATKYIGELVDLKIIHQIRSGVSVSSKQGQRFDAFMLELQFLYWRPDETELRGIRFLETRSARRFTSESQLRIRI